MGLRAFSCLPAAARGACATGEDAREARAPDDDARGARGVRTGPAAAIRRRVTSVCRLRAIVFCGLICSTVSSAIVAASSWPVSR